MPTRRAAAGNQKRPARHGPIAIGDVLPGCDFGGYLVDHRRTMVEPSRFVLPPLHRTFAGNSAVIHNRPVAEHRAPRACDARFLWCASCVSPMDHEQSNEYQRSPMGPLAQQMCSETSSMIPYIYIHLSHVTLRPDVIVCSLCAPQNASNLTATTCRLVRKRFA